MLPPDASPHSASFTLMVHFFGDLSVAFEQASQSLELSRLFQSLSLPLSYFDFFVALNTQLESVVHLWAQFSIHCLLSRRKLNDSTAFVKHVYP